MTMSSSPRTSPLIQPGCSFVMPSLTETSSITTSLLTPPITPRSEKDIPFKPTDSDNTSLSMTKRHKIPLQQHRHRHHLRACKSSGDDTVARTKQSTTDTIDIVFARSKSMPALHTVVLPASERGSTANRSMSRFSVQGRPRRWTLPWKSGATRGLTTLNPLVKYQGTLTGIRADLSPAMITLRRATIKPARRTNLTFFPPPTFGRSRSGFLSYMMKQMVQYDQEPNEDFSSFAAEIGHERDKRTASLVIDEAHPTISVTAGPALTEILPDILLNSAESTLRQRRCSTRFLSGTSTYEVIWDENDTPSSTSNPSPPSSMVPEATNISESTTARRPSVAMDQLEAQLLRSATQSRPTSHATFRGCSSRRGSVQSMINFKFSRFINENALRNLPRSNAAHTLKTSTCNVVSAAPAVHQTFEQEKDQTQFGDEAFFPPLSSGGCFDVSGSTERPAVPELARSRKLSTVGHRSRMGSMLGASSHIRRRSCVPSNKLQSRRTSVAADRRRSCDIISSRRLSGLERVPLLDAAILEELGFW